MSRFANSCFISYSSGDGVLLESFIPQVQEAFASSLGPYLKGMPVYLDKTRMSGGEFIDVTIARELCRSLCMILVYSPTYHRSHYCRSEFYTMAKLEESRWRAARITRPSMGMIIPILLRGSMDEMPPDIASRRELMDFSKFTTADRRIIKNRRYVERIEQTAENIYRMSESLDASNAVFDDCEQLELLSQDEIPEWKPTAIPRLPGREPTK